MISRINSNIVSLEEFTKRRDIKSLQLHSNKIKKIEPIGFGLAHSLVFLDLSSNEIEDIDGIQSLKCLQYLNLSNNLLSFIPNLESMMSLVDLNLSYNQIQSLSWLTSLHGPGYPLEVLDVKCNRIREAHEVYHLIGLTNLHHLIISLGDPGLDNPCCQKTNFTSYLFQSIPTLKSIDGRDVVMKHVEIPEYPEHLLAAEERPRTLKQPQAVQESVIMQSRFEALEQQLSELKINQTLPKGLEETLEKLTIQNQELIKQNEERQKVIELVEKEREILRNDLERIKEQNAELLQTSSREVENKLDLISKENRFQIKTLQCLFDAEVAKNEKLCAEVEGLRGSLEGVTDRYEELERMFSQSQKDLDTALSAVRMEKQKNETFQAKLEKVQLNESYLTKQLDTTINEHMDLQKAHSALEIKLRSSEEEKAKLSLQMMKDKELTRNNMDKFKFDLENALESQRKILIDKERIEEHLKQESEQKIWALESQRKRDLDMLFKDMSEKMDKERREDLVKYQKLASVNDSLKAENIKLKQDYENLNEEFGNRLKELREREKEAEFYKQGKSQLQTVNRELETVIVEQKRELATITIDLKRTIDMQMKRIIEIQEKWKIKSNMKYTDHSLKKQLQSYQQQLLDKDDEIFRLQRNLKVFQEDIVEKQEIKQKASDIENQLRKDNSKLREENAALKQAITIKEKMLDDQNETLRKLKQDLNIKNQELNQAQDKAVCKERVLDEQVRDLQRLNADMEKEMKMMEKREFKMEKLLDDISLERSEYKKEAEALEMQLKERNAMIEMIELEVGKVKESLGQEKMEIDKKYRDEISLLKNEKEALIKKKSELEEEIKIQKINFDKDRETLQKVIIELKKQLKVVLLELEKQKKTMEVKFRKLKAALDQ